LCSGRNPSDHAQSSYTTARASSFDGFLRGVGQRVRWRWSLQERPAELQGLAALRIGEKAEVADFDQARGQDVEEKPADKLDSVQRHEPGLVGMG
jgi:hypothetical protein